MQAPILTPAGAANATLEQRYDALISIVRALDSVVIGYSGGTDSALLVKVAHDQLGERALAISAV
jgi:uncharacterized protein